MAKIKLTQPPQPPKTSYDHSYFRMWLEKNLYLKVCAYCLVHNIGGAIDHIIPESFDKSKARDPDNLLLSCSNCNGSQGKWDYHPDHVQRKKLRGTNVEHKVINIKVDDLAVLYSINMSTGQIAVNNQHPRKEFAKFNYSLLRMDQKNLVKDRKDMIELQEYVLKELDNLDEHKKNNTLNSLNVLLRHLCKYELFFIVFFNGLHPKILKAIEELERCEAQAA